MRGSGKGLHQSKSRMKIAVLGRETFFPAYAKAVQLCAIQRLVTRLLLPVQLAVLTASSAERFGLCLIGLPKYRCDKNEKASLAVDIDILRLLQKARVFHYSQSETVSLLLCYLLIW